LELEIYNEKILEEKIEESTFMMKMGLKKEKTDDRRIWNCRNNRDKLLIKPIFGPNYQKKIFRKLSSIKKKMFNMKNLDFQRVGVF
jgi:hypothetical protein